MKQRRRENARIETLRRRFQRLAGRLARTGWLLLGTIHERRIQRPARAGKRPRTYGPYYQWTFRRAGKTITVNLSSAQVAPFRNAIRNQRAVETALEEMRRLSRLYLDETTEGVPKRKPRT